MEILNILHTYQSGNMKISVISSNNLRNSKSYILVFKTKDSMITINCGTNDFTESMKKLIERVKEGITISLSMGYVSFNHTCTSGDLEFE